MDHANIRGSQRLLESWENRHRHVITDDDVKQLAEVLDASPAQVGDVTVAGSGEGTGVGLSLSYTGDDIPLCGNDLTRIPELLRKTGAPSRPPVVIINGVPWPDRVTVLATLGVLPASAWDAVIPQYRGSLLDRGLVEEIAGVTGIDGTARL